MFNENESKAVMALVHAVVLWHNESDSPEGWEHATAALHDAADSLPDEVLQKLVAVVNMKTMRAVANEEPEFVYVEGAAAEELDRRFREALAKSNVTPPCAACDAPAEVMAWVTRLSDNEQRDIPMCKQHMLDPGPLLDW